MISAVAAIAIWLSMALSGARASTSSDALKLRAVAVDAPTASLPAIRQIAVESSTLVRPEHRSPSIGFGIDRSTDIVVAAASCKHARSVGSLRQHVPPRRLALRYDATAPPAVL